MKKTNVLIIIFIAIVLLVLTVVLLACTVFIVRHIKVESDIASPIVNEENIIESSGIEIGKSIISINKDKVRAAIEKDHPKVKVTFIERVFPNTVIIKVTVRTAVMTMDAEDESCFAVLDSDLKVLEIRSFVEKSSVQFTPVSGVSFSLPEEGAEALIGTVLDRESDPKKALVYSIAKASIDPNLDLGGASFKSFFLGITVSNDGGYAYLLTNTGVSFVLDTSLSTSIYEQLSRCKYCYDSEDTEKNKYSGYIAYDKYSESLGYKWFETYGS